MLPGATITEARQPDNVDGVWRLKREKCSTLTILPPETVVASEESKGGILLFPEADWSLMGRVPAPRKGVQVQGQDVEQFGPVKKLESMTVCQSAR